MCIYIYIYIYIYVHASNLHVGLRGARRTPQGTPTFRIGSPFAARLFPAGDYLRLRGLELREKAFQLLFRTGLHTSRDQLLI